MAKRTFMTQGLSFSAQSTASALTSSTYMAIQGGAAANITDVLEILISGMASASTVASMEFAAVSTVATGITALTPQSHDFGMNQFFTGTTAATTYTTATTAGPQMATATSALALNLALNLFGGIIRWNAAPTQQVTMVGASALTGSFALYNSTAGSGASGLANAHIIYEPY